VDAEVGYVRPLNVVDHAGDEIRPLRKSEILLYEKEGGRPICQHFEDITNGRARTGCDFLASVLRQEAESA